MFFRRASPTEQAITAKLLGFQRFLATKKQDHAQDLYAYFLLDLLDDVLKQMPEVTSLLFPLNDYDTGQLNTILYEQYELFFLADNALTAQEYNSALSKTSRLNSVGIGFYKNKLHKINFHPNGSVSGIGSEIEETAKNAENCRALKLAIQKYHFPRFKLSSRRNANQEDRPMIGEILNQSHTEKKARVNDLLVVIELINTMESKLKSAYDHAKQSKEEALKAAVIYSLAVGGLNLIPGGFNILLKYALGTLSATTVLAKLTLLAYLTVGLMAVCLLTTLGMALYCYLRERQCSAQLIKLGDLVNQSKSYEFTGDTDSLESNMIGRSSFLSAQIKVSIEESAISKKVKLAANYPNVSSLFRIHEDKLKTIEPSFRLGCG